MFRAALTDLVDMAERAAHAPTGDGADTGYAGHEKEPDDAIWFALDPLPGVRELAERYGNPTGERVHFGAHSIRYRWLDLALRAARQDPQRPMMPTE